MRLFLSVIALAFASPSLAQNAPADQHAGHAEHTAQPASPASTACTPEHAAMGHCKLDQASPTTSAGQKARHGHDGDCCKKEAKGKMACCEKARTTGKDCCADDSAASSPGSGHSHH